MREKVQGSGSKLMVSEISVSYAEPFSTLLTTLQVIRISLGSASVDTLRTTLLVFRNAVKFEL